MKKKQKSNIYLMGFMGCGKSKVGKLLADLLNWPFLDIDESIIAETGSTIQQLFEKQGEPFFRQLEKSWIHRIAQLSGTVISLGGGAVVDPENWEMISTTGITITLSYPPSVIAARLAGKNDRPLLNRTPGMDFHKSITQLMSKRESYYKRADLVLHLNTEIDARIVAHMLFDYVKGKA